MKIKKLIRIEVITVIDGMEVMSYDIMSNGGISSRGRVTSSHIEKTLVLFNRFEIKLPGWRNW